MSLERPASRVPHSPLASLSLAESAELVRCGELSPVELTTALLERIEALEPRLNAFVALDPEAALRQARDAERTVQRTADNKSLGVLQGVPVAIKDLFDVRGLITTAGSTFCADNVAQRDSFVVARLRHAGAILLGKTLTHEWALGTTCINPHYGTTRNPWDVARIPGGSSGGNAAGLAARMFAGAIGSDTGGSIRIPASLCGVVGLKPTRGRLSLSGVVPLSWSLDHAGPMARSVADVELLLAAAEGYDAADPVSSRAPANGDRIPEAMRAGHGVRELRLGIPTDHFWDRLAPGIEGAVRSALEVLQDAGAQLVDLPRMGWAGAVRASGHMLLADAAAVHAQRLAQHPELFGADVLQRLRRGQRITGPEYAAARRAQSEWRQRMRAVFGTVHVLAMPTTPEPARLIDEADAVVTARTLTSLTAPFNLTGLPAVSVPCGLTSNGLPIGLQLVAPWWRERLLLKVAGALEAATEWHRMQPTAL